MPGAIDPQFINELKERIPLSTVIESYGIALKKKGALLTCHSPFREEKTASFDVNDAQGVWIDRGDADRGGDALRFIMEYDNKPFNEAVHHLASIGGIPVVYDQNSNFDPQKAAHFNQKRTDIKAVHTSVANLYHQALTHQVNANAFQYLTQRGLTADTISKFSIGYAPDDNRFVRSRADTKLLNPLVDGGILIRGENSQTKKKFLFDRFQDRIMFPIKEMSGDIVGFGGRDLNGKSDAKYLNTPETIAYKKGRNLYGLHEAIQADKNPESLIIVEGYMDVCKMHQYGFVNTASNSGTSITLEQVSLAFRYTDQLTFAFDGDTAGIKAAYKAMDNALEWTKEGKTLNFAFMVEGEDPDSILSKHGAQGMNKILSEAISLSEFAVYRAMNGLDPEKEADLSQIAKNTVEIISKMPDSLYRDSVAAKMSDALSLPKERILETVDRLTAEKKSLKAQQMQKKPNITQENSANTTPQTPNLNKMKI